MIRFWTVVALLGGLSAAVVPGVASGQTDQPAVQLPEPSGQVILTVTGLDPARFPGGQVQFDLAMLRALDRVEFRTSSMWTEGVHLYAGVALSTLIRMLGVTPEAQLTLQALNDYDVSMPAREARPSAPILAYEMDGTPMPVRSKGPLWVVYPYDSDAAYRTVVTFARSVWQLDRIDVTQ